MNQKHHRETVHLKKLRRSHGLLKSVLIVVSIFALYWIVVLVSYSPFDPSWSQITWSGFIHNSGSGLGAWFADILLLTVGSLAYALPLLIMLCFCWIAFIQLDRRNFVDHCGLVLRIIGSLMLLITSCGLAALNINDHDYFALGGGIIGIVLSNAMLGSMSRVPPWGTAVRVVRWVDAGCSPVGHGSPSPRQ